MTDPHDPFDNWLHTQIEPLSPPPGTFDQIRKRARRRKTRRTVLSAASAGAAAALIVVAVVALPRVVPSVLHLKSHPDAQGHTSSRSFANRNPSSATASSVPATNTAGPVIPGGFAPSSVTFVNFSTGYVLGQRAACSGLSCTVMARTDNYGQSWHGVTTLPVGAPDGGTGVSQVRFLNPDWGWAFGPQLYATRDGGTVWTPVKTGGLRVVSLETVGSEAFAVFAKCTGSGADWAAGCTQFSLHSANAGSDAWQPVPGVPSFSSADGSASSATIVLTHSQGYLYTPAGLLLSGPVTGTAPWTAVRSTPLPCRPGPAGANGRPSGGQLAASEPGDLALACPSAAGNTEFIYTTTDGGSSWQPQASFSLTGAATSLATGLSNQVLTLATTQGIESSLNGGQSWAMTQHGPNGGFSYVGMSNQYQGVAVPTYGSQYDAMWFTRDSGTVWQKSLVKNS